MATIDAEATEPVETSVDEWIEADLYQIEVWVDEVRKSHRSGKKIAGWKLSAIRSATENLDRYFRDQDRLSNER